MGGNTAPPDTGNIRKEAPRLVCLPSPPSDNVKIVGKMQVLKKSTKPSIAMRVLPFVPIATAMNTMMSLIYAYLCIWLRRWCLGVDSHICICNFRNRSEQDNRKEEGNSNTEIDPLDALHTCTARLANALKHSERIELVSRVQRPEPMMNMDPQKPPNERFMPLGEEESFNTIDTEAGDISPAPTKIANNSAEV
ncbi:hypothetical protein AOQ84DRAFT_359065 [Glonium stellatum]|uniref:Uncharacterized protein n=1 Tax=Glonium stellatum TaxID=574774 RepID=A0A8E2JYF5_9PEZI|nr:hypothetical protein AOQ84DRAFT_359065 [Glonium stellatum]